MATIMRTLITPPAITLGNRAFYFFPELVIVKHGSRFGAVGYDDLQVRCQMSRFIEDETPPTDAQVIGHTWKHPNKSGGPDRRFRDNRQLPVCLSVRGDASVQWLRSKRANGVLSHRIGSTILKSAAQPAPETGIRRCRSNRSDWGKLIRAASANRGDHPNLAARGFNYMTASAQQNRRTFNPLESVSFL